MVNILKDPVKSLIQWEVKKMNIIFSTLNLFSPQELKYSKEIIPSFNFNLEGSSN